MKEKQTFPAALDPAQRYSVIEAAAYLRISRALLHQRIKDGLIESFKDGHRRFLHGSTLIKASRPPQAA